MEENTVKIISMSIEKLHGCYNYDVNFNSDVTFIFGMNGCGKTTILNITEAIITGQLFKLFNYKFGSIKLKYAKSPNMDSVNIIKILSTSQELTIYFNN